MILFQLLPQGSSSLPSCLPSYHSDEDVDQLRLRSILDAQSALKFSHSPSISIFVSLSLPSVMPHRMTAQHSTLLQELESLVFHPQHPPLRYVYQTWAENLYLAAVSYQTVKLLRLIRLRQRGLQGSNDAKMSLSSVPDEIYSIIEKHVIINVQERAAAKWSFVLGCSCDIMHVADYASEELYKYSTFRKSYSCNLDCCDHWDDPRLVGFYHNCWKEDHFEGTQEARLLERALRREMFAECDRCVAWADMMWRRVAGLSRQKLLGEVSPDPSPREKTVSDLHTLKSAVSGAPPVRQSLQED